MGLPYRWPAEWNLDLAWRLLLECCTNCGKSFAGPSVKQEPHVGHLPSFSSGLNIALFTVRRTLGYESIEETVKMKYETKISIIGKSSENDLTRSDLEREARRLGKMHPVAKFSWATRELL